MSIQVKFFASLRETIGQADAIIDSDTITSVADVWAQATNGIDMPTNTLCAINMEYVDALHSVTDNDEVAFFPPVTGG